MTELPSASNSMQHSENVRNSLGARARTVYSRLSYERVEARVGSVQEKASFWYEHSAGCYSSRFHESAHGAFDLFWRCRPIANTDSDDRSSMPG